MCILCFNLQVLKSNAPSHMSDFYKDFGMESICILCQNLCKFRFLSVLRKKISGMSLLCGKLGHGLPCWIRFLPQILRWLCAWSLKGKFNWLYRSININLSHIYYLWIRLPAYCFFIEIWCALIMCLRTAMCSGFLGYTASLWLSETVEEVMQF